MCAWLRYFFCTFNFSVTLSIICYFVCLNCTCHLCVVYRSIIIQFNNIWYGSTWDKIFVWYDYALSEFGIVEACYFPCFSRWYQVWHFSFFSLSTRNTFHYTFISISFTSLLWFLIFIGPIFGRWLWFCDTRLYFNQNIVAKIKVETKLSFSFLFILFFFLFFSFLSFGFCFINKSNEEIAIPTHKHNFYYVYLFLFDPNAR